MKTKLISSLIFTLLGGSLCAQTPADTTLTLGNVDVEGRRSITTEGFEVSHINLDNRFSSSLFTAGEALRQLPSVVSDIEGDIFYRGSSRTAFLLGGVPYGLFEENAGDVFIQLPSFFFNKLALSSYPAASLLPDGDAGVIDLISSSQDNSPLQLTLGGGLHNRYNAGIVSSIRTRKFLITAKYDYRKEYRKRNFSKTTTDASGTTMLDNNAAARPDVHIADLNIAYDLSPKDVISAYGMIYHMDYSRTGNIDNTKLDAAGKIKNHIIRHRYNDQMQRSWASEMRWNHRFENGGSLYSLFNFNNFDYDENNDFQNENPTSGKIVAQDNLFVNRNKKNYYATMAYNNRFANGVTLNGGLTGRWTKEHFTTDANALKAGTWTNTPNKSNDFSFKREVEMAFLTIKKDWEGFSAEAGLQGEAEHRESGDVDHNRFSVYPRLQLIRHFGNDNLIFSYVERAVRPMGSQLNPFVDLSDVTHIIQGNTDLKNERIRSAQLSFHNNNSVLSFTPTLYFRYRSNRIYENIYVLNNQDIWKVENSGNNKTAGFELTTDWNPVRWFSLNAAADVYRNEIDGRIAGYDDKKALNCFDIRGLFAFHLSRNTELQADGFFVSDQLTPQGKIRKRGTVNAGISQYFMQRKLRAQVSIDDIFDTLGETTVINSDKLKMTQKRSRDARVAWLNLTWTL